MAVLIPIGEKEGTPPPLKKQRTSHCFTPPDSLRGQFYLFKAIRESLRTPYFSPPLPDDGSLWEEFDACDFPNWVLERQSEVTQLFILQKGLEELPQELFLLKHLTVLRIAHNHLKELPPKLFQMESLLELDLSYNQLTVLPREIENLSNLRELCASNNPIETLDARMEKLPHLRSLYLSHTHLTELPSLQGSSLQALWFRGHTLKEVDATLLPKSLKSLNLNQNQIQRLIGDFSTFKQLDHFTLYENQLTGLPKSFAGLTRLRVLEMGGNAFEKVPDILSELPRLEQLHLSQNRLKTLPEWLARLTEFCARNNQIQEIPVSLKKTPMYLDLRGNPCERTFQKV